MKSARRSSRASAMPVSVMYMGMPYADELRVVNEKWGWRKFVGGRTHTCTTRDWCWREGHGGRATGQCGHVMSS